MLIKTIYDDVALDNVNTAENGNLDFAMFNRISRRAELRMIDFLSGDIENQKPPMPYTSQKDKDWLAPFITQFPQQVTGGRITRPVDYYGYENMYRLGSGDQAACGDDIAENGCNTPIELLDGRKFYTRCETFIEGLNPSFKKPIAKAVGKDFEFLPADLGSIMLEYVRYPVFGKIVVAQDTVHNDQIIDEANSTNYEWEEYARELLVYFITDTYSIHTREQALKQFNQATAKTVRG